MGCGPSAEEKEESFIAKSYTRPQTEYYSYGDVYDTFEEIGRDTVSCVRRAKSKTSEEEVMIKYVDQKIVDYEALAVLRKFVTQHGEHPNLLKVIEIFETDQICLVTELAEDALFHRIGARDRYTEKDVACIVLQILDGLHHLHSQGVAHSFLEPSSFLCSADDKGLYPFRIMIATSFEGIITQDLLSKKSTGGEPSLFAPEVLASDDIEDPLACDMWTVGVITYILLCGSAPFESADGTDLEKVMSAELVFQGTIWEKVSEEARDFISRLIEQNPKDRWNVEEAKGHPWLMMAKEEQEGAILDQREIEKYYQRFMTEAERRGIAM
eukprot:TRINITY_DN5504_c0_g1_i1.p1 TRINITY_DN5504_c0_g1~~TRINITY_DN5504_c0_g1_i1.p1  ORF type:complete len:326 (+),score=58.73 TRINITY_DN5504_c0_g1_i1:145-1122(+)